MHWYDILGTLGVLSIIFAYAAVQSGRLAPTRLLYSMMNLIGAILILVSLAYNFNLASVVIEVFWILISVWGIVKWFQARRELMKPPIE
ncbi:MAG: hypothetical protein O3B41_01345 [Bacteroidetes bacterium]|nr:hypothetical protein [Bacteroidota bacterium]